MSHEGSVAAIRRAATPAVADAIERTLRPAVALRATPAKVPVAAGKSKFGGYPDLPEAIPWPSIPADVEPTRKHLRRLESSVPGPHYTSEQWAADLAALRDVIALGGRPLAFLGQIELGVLPPLDIDLPRSGMLFFFYDAEEQPWGFEPTHRNHWRVLYVADPVLPEDRVAHALGPRAPFRECAVDGCPIPTFAEIEPRPPTVPPRLYNEAFQVVRELYPVPAHWLGGQLLAVQAADADWDCQRASHGVGSATDDPADREWQDQALVPGVADWTLLLQLDSDEDGPGWIWGDSGSLYFYIRRQDLALLDFSNVWCVLQCG